MCRRIRSICWRMTAASSPWPGLVGDVRFVREHRERRLQRVRQVAGLRDRAPHGLIAMLEQRVEIVDERLHLAGIPPLDAPIRCPGARRRGARAAR